VCQRTDTSQRIPYRGDIIQEESSMSNESHSERPAWRPRVEQEPEFNPFVNTADPSSVLNDLPLLAESSADSDAAPDALEHTGTTAAKTGPTLRSLKDLEGFVIQAMDGTIGHVKDFYFDDQTWTVRYIIVETGSWLSSRKVLISPLSLLTPDWSARALPVSITIEQVKLSPDIDTDKPVFRQHEALFLGYYGYPYYWAGNGLWGGGAYPGSIVMGLGAGGGDAPYRHAQAEDERAATAAISGDGEDPHLRSCHALLRYHIEASDGGMGPVRDLLFDDHSWAIRYLSIDTSNWWLGHEVLIAPQWITQLSWPDAAVSVALTQQAIKAAPPYVPSAPLERQYEERLYRHYDRVGYWVSGAPQTRS
jgi:hypothetical protein